MKQATDRDLAQREIKRRAIPTVLRPLNREEAQQVGDIVISWVIPKLRAAIDARKAAQ